MKKTIRLTIYFFIAALLVVDGLIVKYSLTDTDLGTRFKNYNHSLLSSDIIFYYALFIAIIGLIFYVLGKSKRSNLKDSTVIYSALLIIPFLLVLAGTPIMETIYPGEVGKSTLSTLFMWFISLATFAAMAWIVMILGTFLKQAVIMLTNKGAKPRPATVQHETSATDAKQFKIKEDGFKEIRKQILMRSIPLMLISGTVGLLIFVFNTANKDLPEGNVLPYIIPMILVFFALGTINVLKRQKAIYKSYELRIDENGIARQQASTPTISLLFSEIKSITKSKQGAYVIAGNNRSNLIIVPAQLEELDVLINIIQANCGLPISHPKPLLERLTLPIALVVIGLMATTYLSANKILVAISGVLLIALMGYSFIALQTNKNIDNRTSRSSYWMIFMILVIIGMIVSKLMI